MGMTASVECGGPGGLEGYGAVEALFAARGTPCGFARNRTVALAEAAIERVYRIEDGFVRCCGFTEGGLRQIFAFAGPGEVIGFPDLGRWHFTVEAVCPVTARALGPQALEAALLDDPRLARALRRHCVAQLEYRERRLVWLSSLHSEERLLAFLRDFLRVAPRAAGYAQLPMTRRDLGDHLGMSLETVSRCFGSLRDRGAIATHGAGRYRLAGERWSGPSALSSVALTSWRAAPDPAGGGRRRRS